MTRTGDMCQETEHRHQAIWLRLRNALQAIFQCVLSFIFSEDDRDDGSREATYEKPEARLLVLGASDTGKSTFMRQMQLLCGHGYPMAERMRHQIHIRRNVLESLHKLVTNLATYEVQTASAEAQDAANAFSEWSKLEPLLEEDADIEQGLAEKSKILWRDPGIQAVYVKRSEYHLITNADYFITNAERIMHKEYVPTVDDILRMRFVTKGSVEHRYELENMSLTMHDMGGQRLERDNWVKQGREPSAILFLASLSEYDQNVEEADENEPRNRMDESMDTFRALLRYPPFQNTHVILILNKTDVFREKIGRVAIRNFFPDFTGAELDEDAGREYITQRYELIADSHRRKMMTLHTEATDTKNFKDVIRFVTDSVSRNMLRIGALI